MSPPRTHTARAIRALSDAITAGEEFAGWLATVLAHVAARHGGSQALTARRPGSWEADLVDCLARGTAGWNDEDLCHYRQPVPRTRAPKLSHDDHQPPGSPSSTLQNS
jgi:hypothetical protein